MDTSNLFYSAIVINPTTGVEQYQSYPMNYDVKCGLLILVLLIGLYLMFKKLKPIEDEEFIECTEATKEFEHNESKEQI